MWKAQLGKEEHSKIDVVRDLRHSFESCLGPLGDVAMRDVLCSASNKNEAVLHVRLSSCVANIPETEDCFWTEISSRTPTPYYLCTGEHDTFSFTTSAKVRVFSGTKLILERHGNAATKSMRTTLKQLLMMPATFVLQPFSIVWL